MNVLNQLCLIFIQRRILAGEYMVINDYLVEDLISLGLWSKELKDKIS